MDEIKRNRNRLGLSTTEFAYRLGVSQSSALRLEQSENAEAISIASLKRAAKALGLKLAYKLIPTEKGSSPRPRERTKGLPRVRVKLRRKSETSQMLTDDTTKRAKSLSPLQRLAESCKLSDLAYELRRV